MVYKCKEKFLRRRLSALGRLLLGLLATHKRGERELYEIGQQRLEGRTGGVEAADDQGRYASDQGLVADFHVELRGRRLGSQGRGQQLHGLAVTGGDLATRGERLGQEAASDRAVAGE